MISIQSTCENKDLEGAVGDDLHSFEEWFKSLGNDPLVKGEIAILKTYLWWKLKGTKDGSQSSSPDPV